MKQIKVGEKDVLVVEGLPEGAHNFTVIKNKELEYWYGRDSHLVRHMSLPKGNWSILGLSKDIMGDKELSEEYGGAIAANNIKDGDLLMIKTK